MSWCTYDWQVLRLSACKYLGETALNALHGGKALSELQELDMSYGSLGRAAIEGVLAMCPHLTQVSLNGCLHVTDHLWSRLATPPQLPLESVASEDTGMEDVSSSDADVVDQPRSPMEIPSQEVTSHQREVEDWQGGTGGAAVQADVSELIEHSEHPGGSHYHHQFSPMVESEVAGPVRSLQTLNCVGCQNIQSVVIQRDAACFHLTTLNLSLASHIREVRLGCDNLTTLNLR